MPANQPSVESWHLPLPCWLLRLGAAKHRLLASPDIDRIICCPVHLILRVSMRSLLFWFNQNVRHSMHLENPIFENKVFLFVDDFRQARCVLASDTVCMLCTNELPLAQLINASSWCCCLILGVRKQTENEVLYCCLLLSDLRKTRTKVLSLSALLSLLRVAVLINAVIHYIIIIM